MKNNLEIKLDEKKGSWIGRAFKEESSTMGNHLIASAFSIAARTTFSYYAPGFMESKAAIAGTATAIDAGVYNTGLFSQFLYRDRKKIKNEEGKLDLKKTGKKIVEYASMAGIIQAIYATGSFAGQYLLQKKGFSPAEASLIIQGSATAFFTFALPPLRYALRQWSEK